MKNNVGIGYLVTILLVGLKYGAVTSLDIPKDGIINSNQPDACKLLAATSKFSSFSSVKDCYEMFQLDNSIRAQTLTTLKKTIPFYIFTDLLKNPSQLKSEIKMPNLSLNEVDLIRELKEMENAPFSSDREFHHAVTKLFIKAYDGHLTFRTNCYNIFSFYFPFAIEAQYDYATSKPSPTIILLPNPKFKTSDLEPFKIVQKDYVGAQLLEIDGIPVLEWLSTFADTMVGVAKDRSTRFNYLMATQVISSNEKKFVFGEFASPSLMPSKGSLDLKLKTKHGIIVYLKEVPYLGEGPKDFTDSKSYYDSYCASSSGSELGSNTKDAQESGSSETEGEYIPQELNINRLEINNLTLNRGFFNNWSSTKADPRIVTSSSYLTTLLLDDGKTGVLVYPTNDASSYDELSKFQSMLHDALKELKNKGAEKLIFDLSFNTGGPICASTSLLDYFVGSEKAPKYTTRMRYSHLVKALALSAKKKNPIYRVWGYKNWVDPYGYTYASPSWIFPANPMSRANETGQLFSNLFMDRCPPSSIAKKDCPFKLNDITVLTNGICLSSCSTLLHGLENTQQVKVIYTNGLGYTNLEASPHNMQGGQLYTFDKLQADLSYFGLLDHINAPKAFPLTTQFTFTLREQYLLFNSAFTQKKETTIKESSVPMEYLSASPTKRIFKSISQDITKKGTGLAAFDYFWNQVAKSLHPPSE